MNGICVGIWFVAFVVGILVMVGIVLYRRIEDNFDRLHGYRATREQADEAARQVESGVDPLLFDEEGEK